MAHGRKTGGRKPGSKNKRTVQREEATQAVAEQISEALGDAFDGDAHALLMAVYKDKAHPIDLRVDAAKAAIRYEKPALASSTSVNENVNTSYVISGEPLEDPEEWAAEFGPKH